MNEITIIDHGPPVDPQPTQSGARMVVVESVYHTTDDGQPLHNESRFGQWLSDAQPYGPRRLKCGEQWQRLDLGWVRPSDCVMLCITNNEGRFTKVQPTPEQVSDMSLKVLEVAVEIVGMSVQPFALLPPEQSLRMPPADVQYFIRCRSGEAKFTVIAIAR